MPQPSTKVQWNNWALALSYLILAWPYRDWPLVGWPLFVIAGMLVWNPGHVYRDRVLVVLAIAMAVVSAFGAAMEGLTMLHDDADVERPGFWRHLFTAAIGVEVARLAWRERSRG